MSEDWNGTRMPDSHLAVPGGRSYPGGPVHTADCRGFFGGAYTCPACQDVVDRACAYNARHPVEVATGTHDPLACGLDLPGQLPVCPGCLAEVPSRAL